MGNPANTLVRLGVALVYLGRQLWDEYQAEIRLLSLLMKRSRGEELSDSEVSEILRIVCLHPHLAREYHIDPVNWAKNVDEKKVN